MPRALPVVVRTCTAYSRSLLGYGVGRAERGQRQVGRKAASFAPPTHPPLSPPLPPLHARLFFDLLA